MLHDVSAWNPQEPDHTPEIDLSLPLPDRRAKVRFALELRVHYLTLDRERRAGEGRVVNLSSSGILVASRQEVSVGDQLEVRVSWPWLLEGRVPLQLVARGKVVRCEASSFAVAFRRHQFRTARNKVQSIDSAPEPRAQAVGKAASA